MHLLRRGLQTRTSGSFVLRACDARRRIPLLAKLNIPARRDAPPARLFVPPSLRPWPLAFDQRPHRGSTIAHSALIPAPTVRYAVFTSMGDVAVGTGNRETDRTGKPLILASGSPRRRELMRQYGYDVTTITPPIDEPTDFDKDIPPAKLAQALSLFKAMSVRDVVDRGIILAGDTVVALEDRVYGKPADRDEARSIIKALAGTTHHVITGVTLLNASTDERLIHHDSTAVTMRPLSNDEVEAYLDTDAWEGKAGAYGIQDRGDAFVTKIEGSFTNVVGFPMELIGRMLEQWGVEPNSSERRRPPYESAG